MIRMCQSHTLAYPDKSFHYDVTVITVSVGKVDADDIIWLESVAVVGT
jgi:hypothetical protein